MPTTVFGDILGLGTSELVVILVILILLYAATKLPQLLRSISSSMKELGKGMQGDDVKSEARDASKARREA